jgi:dinuclear metal center YbgI/SA1388 family protein
MTTAPLAAVVEYLDQYLRIGEIPDYAGAVNGLQVGGPDLIGGVVAAVDASQATIDGAIAARARFAAPPLVLAHHGLFWDGGVPVTGRRYRRLAALIRNDVPLYAAHIPLDVHPEVGNNAVLATRLGLTDCRRFDDFKGVPLGVRGTLPGGISRSDLVARIDRLLGTTSRLLAGGEEEVHEVGVITGGAGTRIGAARAAGLDAFVTGEGPHHTYFDAMELGINVIFAGHYATEQVGVQALADKLGRVFGIPHEFHDHPTGL